MGFDPTLHNHINFLLKFSISHDFSYRVARDSHHLSKTFLDLSFETVVYNIISRLRCRGVAAVAIGLIYSDKQQS